ncbi:hypothetical protein JCM10049v2_007632 [Rhodotorula toruloides]
MPTLVCTGCSSSLGLLALSSFVSRIIASPPSAQWRILAAYRSTSLTAGQEELAKRCREHPDKLSLDWMTLDLLKLSSVEAFARRVKEALKEEEGVDVLFINAAMYNMGARTVDLGGAAWTQEALVNHLSQHYLVQMLAPLLTRASANGLPRSRLVFTSSQLHTSIKSLDELAPRLKPSTTDHSSGKSRYAASKVAQLISARYWQRHFAAAKADARPVDVVTVSPGFVPTTGLTRDVPLLGRLLMRYILSLMPFAVSESEGAARLARTIPASPSDSDDALSSLLAELSKADNPPLIFLAGPSTASVPTVEEVRSGAKGAVKGGVAEDLLARTEDDEMWKQVGWLLPSEDTMRSWSAST